MQKNLIFPKVQETTPQRKSIQKVSELSIQDNVYKKPDNNFQQISIRKRLWTANDDFAIKELVNEYGEKKWALIARKLAERYQIKGRTGKQCRERWHNHINPGVARYTFSVEEEKLLFEGHDRFGNKWSEIAKYMKGRTDNMLKNYFYSTLRRIIRRIAKIAKIPKSKVIRTSAADINIEYIYRLIQDYNVEISVIDNDEIKKRVLMLIEGKPIDLSENYPKIIINSFNENKDDNNISQNHNFSFPISTLSSKVPNLFSNDKNQNNIHNNEIDNPIILNERKKIFKITKSIVPNHIRNITLSIPNDNLLRPPSSSISIDQSKVILNKRKSEFDIPSSRENESPIYNGLQLNGFKKFNSVKEQINSIFPSEIQNLNNIGNSLLKDTSSTIQFQQELNFLDNQNFIGNLRNSHGNLHDRRPNLSIDLEKIQSDYSNDPLFNIANYIQMQNFLNIYSSKNQNLFYSPMQYFNEISSLNRTPLHNMNKFSPKL